jgi:hypothetical protein
VARQRTVTLETALKYHKERERAIDYTRERWRKAVGVVRTVSIALGAIAFGGWLAQDPPSREPLSINLNGEQALAVVGLAMLIFGIGTWVGLHLPSAPSKRAEARVDAEQSEARADDVG